jgi:Domain of unknown function (DUF222)
MSSDTAEDVLAAYAELDAALDKVLGLSHDVLTHAESVVVLERMERIVRRAPAVAHPIINRLVAEASPQALGGKSLADVLCIGLRISKSEASRRIADARDLGPRTALTGESLEPVLSRTAAAQQHGDLGAEHVKIIRDFFHHLPTWVDYQTRELAEKDLVRSGAGLKPEELGKVAEQLMAMLHPDGDYSDAERARRRYLTIGKQGPDGLSEVRGRLDPETRASLDAVLAKNAAPGVGNPEEGPDTRTQGQRNHDGLKAMAQSALASGELGLHNGLPTTIIVTTTLQDLESAAGQAVTGGGTLLPMRDVIRLAAHAHHYLCIYDKHTREPLYLGRTKRLASAAQRIALYGLEGGCTRPGCTAPPDQSQVHHIQGWAAQHGPTDINKLTLACAPDNRLAEHGWTVRKRKDGRTEWIPPEHLDTGQTRVNNYHHPEKYLINDDDEDP